MRQVRAGFTVVELAAAVGIVGVLLAVLMPMAGRVRNGDGLQVSIQNMATIIEATQAYHFDHVGQVPMRATAYSSGNAGGSWDVWNVGGKNCDVYWQTSLDGVFDESAYGRFLNPYVFSGRIPVPPGYVSTGSGSTWHFAHGTPTPEQRANLEIPVFKSPGDMATRQRTWPTPTPEISAYDDVGSSYMNNMKWWDLPELSFMSFAVRYNEGCRRAGVAFSGANPNFVFMHDQNGDIVANLSPSGAPQPGEFGKMNASVVGYADGRAAYIQLVTSAMSGPGYTFAP